MGDRSTAAVVAGILLLFLYFNFNTVRQGGQGYDMILARTQGGYYVSTVGAVSTSLSMTAAWTSITGTTTTSLSTIYMPGGSLTHSWPVTSTTQWTTTVTEPFTTHTLTYTMTYPTWSYSTITVPGIPVATTTVIYTGLVTMISYTYTGQPVTGVATTLVPIPAGWYALDIGQGQSLILSPILWLLVIFAIICLAYAIFKK